MALAAKGRTPRTIRSTRRVGIGQQLTDTSLAHHPCRCRILFVTIDIDIADAQPPQFGDGLAQKARTQSSADRVAMHHRLADVAMHLPGTRRRLISGEILGQAITDKTQQLPLLLGSVAVSTRAALLRQIAPREARDAGNGRSLAKSRNDAWRNLPRNPKGRASFCVVRRYSTAHLGDQTSRLAPSPRKNWLRRGRARNGNRP